MSYPSNVTTTLPNARLIYLFVRHSCRNCKDETFHAASYLYSALERTALRSKLRSARYLHLEEEVWSSRYIVTTAFTDPHVDLTF